jgi:hypothetical protein
MRRGTVVPTVTCTTAQVPPNSEQPPPVIGKLKPVGKLLYPVVPVPGVNDGTAPTLSRELAAAPLPPVPVLLKFTDGALV